MTDEILKANCVYKNEDCPICPKEIPLTWEIEWKEFCQKQANGFDRFSPLQRSGIAGCFEINGKPFIETSRQEALLSFLKGEIVRLEGEKNRGSHEYSNDDADLGYNQCLASQIAHYQSIIQESEK